MSGTLWQYYLDIAEKITADAYSGINSADAWEKRRPALHHQFMQSLGLDVLPDRSGLRIEQRGEFSGNGFKAVKIAYEILKDCWGSGTVYYPDPLSAGKAPGVLYLCGHQSIGILGYQRHALMWARRGYVCFIFDTIEQHDNGGDHHGTCHRSRYDWISMGYTGSGGEVWNSMRALDVLCGLPEVDPDKIGATGISGGGAQSFYLTVADERVKALATSCGVTLQNYTLAHRHLQHHCDCMYMMNIFQKSMGEYAGLIAPRPALYCFGSDDALFSPEEYRQLVEQAQTPYKLLGCLDKCELLEYEAPHMYVPESFSAINAWFDRHVAGKDHPAIQPGDEAENSDLEVTVFNGNPPRENKTYILPELLSTAGSAPLPESKADWPDIKKDMINRLREGPFAALSNFKEKAEFETQGLWKGKGGPDNSQRRQSNRYKGVVGGMDIWIKADTWFGETEKFVFAPALPDETCSLLHSRLFSLTLPNGLIVMEGRTGGLNSAHPDMDWYLLRGGALIGLTPVVVMVQDILLALDFICELPYVKNKPLYLYGKGDEGAACIYAALFDERVSGVIAEGAPASHRNGAYIPGILNVMDIDHAVGLIAPRPVGLVGSVTGTNWSRRAYERIGCAEKKIVHSSLKTAMDMVVNFAPLLP